MILYMVFIVLAGIFIKIGLDGFIENKNNSNGVKYFLLAIFGFVIAWYIFCDLLFLLIEGGIIK